MFFNQKKERKVWNMFLEQSLKILVRSSSRHIKIDLARWRKFRIGKRCIQSNF